MLSKSIKYILAIIAVSSGIVVCLIFIGRARERMTPSDPRHQICFTSLSDEFFKVSLNDSYQVSDPGYPVELNQLIGQSEILSLMISRLGNDGLFAVRDIDSNGLPLYRDEFSKRWDYIDVPDVFEMSTEEGGSFAILINKNKEIDGFILHYYGNTLEEEVTLLLESFLTEDGTTLGKEQVSIVNTYDNTEDLFYFDKGIGFIEGAFVGRNAIVIFKPSAEINYELIENIRSNYHNDRNRMVPCP